MGQKEYSLRASRAILAAFAFFGSLSVAMSQAAAGQGRIGLVLETSFAAAEMNHTVEGAKSTVLVPARETSAGVDTFSAAEWKEERLAWPEVMSGAMEVADELVEVMKIDWVRDRNGVIVYGEVRSKSPFLGSAMFSKRFLDRFRGELGSEVHAVMPEQGTLFVFPRHGGKLADFGPALVERYRDSALKVSLEVFLVDRAGCRVVGALGEVSRF